MLTIRLQRTGKKNQADFRIVLAEKEAPVKKKHLEVLGSYNPHKKDFKVNEERVKYWVSQRVQLSPTVHNLFVTKGILQADKVQAFSVPKKQSDEIKSATPTTPSPETADTPPQAPTVPSERAGGEKILEVPAQAEAKPAEPF